jgi:hypothetical protein
MSTAVKTGALTTVTNEAIALFPTSTKPFNFSFVVVASATIGYDVEFTIDGTTWHNHATVAAQTATATGTLTFPVAGVRLVVNSVTGGSAQLFGILD